MEYCWVTRRLLVFSALVLNEKNIILKKQRKNGFFRFIFQIFIQIIVLQAFLYRLFYSRCSFEVNSEIVYPL